jgi:HNH endonuclease
MPETRNARGRLVAERARDACEYCRSQARFATHSFSVEHVVPLNAGGSDEPENLALACQGCNNHKYTKTEARDPISGALVPLFNPRLQLWRDHFLWSADFTRILGTTPVGRATVEALHLNRAGLLNLRELLYAAGKHPPLDSEGA